VVLLTLIGVTQSVKQPLLFRHPGHLRVKGIPRWAPSTTGP